MGLFFKHKSGSHRLALMTCLLLLLGLAGEAEFVIKERSGKIDQQHGFYFDELPDSYLKAGFIPPPGQFGTLRSPSSASEQDWYENLLSTGERRTPKDRHVFTGKEAWGIFIFLFSLSGLLLLSLVKLRLQQEQLRENSVQKSLLMNSIAEGVFGVDLNGDCTFCNAATLKLLGYASESDLTGKNIHKLIHHSYSDGSDYPAPDCKLCQAFKEDKKIHIEDEVLWRSDGSWFKAEYRAYPLHKGDKLLGAVVSFVDITERKEAEEKLQLVNQELDAFVYTVCHDLRTPISAVVGYSELIRDNYNDEMSPEALECLAHIEAQGDKMSVLVNDLLVLAKTGQIAPPANPVNTLSVLKYVLDEFNGALDEVEVKVEAETLPDIKIPETFLVQIFENLVGNAMRYAGKQGAPIEIGGRRDGDRACLWVADHGPGVPEGERASVFNVFNRGSTSAKMAGSGVGLATVMKIARLYEGRAWIQETQGGGATFWVEVKDGLVT